MRLDARIPLLVTPDPPPVGSAAAVVSANPAPGAMAWRAPGPARLAGHRGACPCCAVRDPVAAALDALFIARARSAVDFFTQAAVVTADTAAVHAALALDAVVGSRYRLLPLQPATPKAP